MSDDPDEREIERKRRSEKADEADYRVGYAKPDPAHQFKVGNKMGSRPRKPRDNSDNENLVRRVGDEKLSITKNGKIGKSTRHEIIIRGVWKDAANGDHISRKQWLDEYRKCKTVVQKDEKYYADEKAAGAEVRRRLERMAERVREIEAEELAKPDVRGGTNTSEPDQAKNADKADKDEGGQ